MYAILYIYRPVSTFLLIFFPSILFLFFIFHTCIIAVLSTRIILEWKEENMETPDFLDVYSDRQLQM